MGTTRRGITFIDLIVVLTLAICLIPLAVAAAGRSRETAYRVKCASNLNQIGKAIRVYTTTHGQFPRTRYRPESAQAPTAWTSPNSTRPFAEDGPAPNDVTAAYRLLISTQLITADLFLCPSATVADPVFMAKRFKGDHANFADERELSYSFANPYPTPAAADAGYSLKNAGDEFALAADINPGGPLVTTVRIDMSYRDTRPANSPNHDMDGQNVLYGDGHVEFQQNPLVGTGRDNIYTSGRRENPAEAQGLWGSPTHADDTLLLPTTDSALRSRVILKQNVSIGLWIAVPVFAGLLLIAAVRLARRPRALPS